MGWEESIANKYILSNTRFTSPHIFQKQPSNRTTLRPRLRPVLLKRRRVDDDPRPFSIPWPIPHPNIVSSSNDPKSTSTNLHSFQKPPNPKSTTLNPCYICHRRPTTRSVLDAYADCSLCGNRACYICLRECLGPHCRTAATVSAGGEKRSKDERDLEDGESEGRKICSTCAVEGVTEYGEDIVWCLECVERDRGSMETS